MHYICLEIIRYLRYFQYMESIYFFVRWKNIYQKNM